MRTNNADVGSSVEYDFSKGELGRHSRHPGEGLDIRVDGAIGYSLRLATS